MKTGIIFYTLAVMLGITVAAGILTPNEADRVLEDVFETLDQAESVLVEEAQSVSDNALALSSELPPPESPADEKVNTPVLFSVVRVIDGDTIVILRDGVSEPIRLIGIDTPETVHPSKPVQCFGSEASEMTKEWLEGEKVYLEIDEQEGERDKYGRMLGYVFRADGFFVNLELIRQGYAYEYTYDSSYKYQSLFQVAEQEARNEENGLWADGVCEEEI